MTMRHRTTSRLIRWTASVASCLVTGAACATLVPSASQAQTRGTGGGGVSSISTPVARAAKTLSLDETGDLRLTSKHGFTLNEQGRASGTVAGTIYVHLTIVSSSRVTVELSIYPSGGSITAHGSASYRKESTQARFAGSMSIERGTGSYAHAQGSGLSFSGTIARANDAITVHVAGRAVD